VDNRRFGLPYRRYRADGTISGAFRFYISKGRKSQNARGNPQPIIPDLALSAIL